MNPDARWQLLESLFLEASELAPVDRDLFVEDRCGTDNALKAELSAMLASGALDSGTFVGKIVQKEAASITGAEQQQGKHIGPYRILNTLGRGGMGAVYLAIRDDDHFQKEVAIKMLRTELSDAASVARFRAERQMLAGLEHPNIARLLDGGATLSQDPYLVMEYVPGRIITEYCSSKKLSNSAKVEMFRQVCDAVNYAHQKLIVHRDLKPANILVTDTGVPKLLDFGIAKLLDPGAEDTLKTMTGYLMMTPDYASPEQVRGEAVTTATDVYALGAVLYELLSGHKPHRLKNYDPAELTRSICETDVRPPSEEGDASLRGDLDTIILKAMQRDPARRYRSVEQFSEDLRRWLNGEAVSARPDTVTYRAGKYIRKHRIGLAALTAVIVALTAGTYVAWRQALEAQARFAQVRKLANRFVFDFHDEIERLPGSVKARQMLVSTALEYLDNLSLSAGDDPGLAAELAAAYDRIGDVQGNPFSSNLGQDKEAVISYTKALAIGEKLASGKAAGPESLLTIAQGHLKVGTMLWQGGSMVEGEGHLKTALQVRQQVAARSTEAHWLLGARVHLSLTACYGYSGKSQAGVAAGHEFRKHTQAWLVFSNGPDQRYWNVVALASAGTTLGAVGRFAEAEKMLKDGRHLLLQLAAEYPDRAAYLRDVGIVNGRIGRLLASPAQLNSGRSTEAIPIVEEMVRIAEASVAADSNDARASHDLLSSSLMAGLAESDVDAVRAVRHFQKAEKLIYLNKSGDRRAFTVEMENVLLGLGQGRIAQRAGRLREAVERYEFSCNAQRDLMKRYPQVGVLSYPYIVTMVHLARANAALGDTNKAEATLKQALNEALASRHPNEIPILAARSDASEALGALAAAAGRTADARAAYQNSLNLWANMRSDEYGARRFSQASQLLMRLE